MMKKVDIVKTLSIVDKVLRALLEIVCLVTLSMLPKSDFNIEQYISPTLYTALLLCFLLSGTSFIINRTGFSLGKVYSYLHTSIYATVVFFTATFLPDKTMVILISAVAGLGVTAIIVKSILIHKSDIVYMLHEMINCMRSRKKADDQ